MCDTPKAIAEELAELRRQRGSALLSAESEHRLAARLEKERDELVIELAALRASRDELHAALTAIVDSLDRLGTLRTSKLDVARAALARAKP